MIINFNYKKFFKYLFILVCFILLCNSFSAKALTNSKVANIITYDSQSFEDGFYKGDQDNLIAFYNTNYNYNIESSFITDIHNYVLNQTGYSTWDNFSNDYYYMIAYVLNTNSTGKGVSAKFYARQKTDGVFDLALSIDSDTRTNPGSSYNTNVFLAPNVLSTDLDYNFSFSFGNINNYSFSANNYGSAIYQLSCSSSSTSCSQSWNSSTNTMTIDIYKYWHNAGHPLFYDHNFSFKFVYNDIKYTNSYSSRYFYSSLDVNGSGNYVFNDILGSIDIYSLLIEDSLIQEFPNNNYGINSGTLDVGVVSHDTVNFTDSDVVCPIQDNLAPGHISKDFVNDVCYFNSSDFVNYDKDFVNFYNEGIIYLPNNDVIIIDSSKYYTFTFRTYSNYSLDVNLLAFKLVNYDALLPATIDSVNINDYSFYYDYQVVFHFDSAFSDLDVSGYFQSIIINFKNMSNYVLSLPDSYSFGLSKIFKLHQYDSLPSTSDLSNDYSNHSLNSLTSSMNGNFFTSFTVKDYGISSVVLLPLNYVRALENATCSSLSLPLPRIGNIQLPCVSAFMSTNFSSIWTLFKLIINGLIIYRLTVSLFSTVKDVYRPDNDRIEVVDL